MKLIGVEHEGKAHVAVVRGDHVAVLASVDEFWRDPQSWQGKAASDWEGLATCLRGDCTEIPLVPASARVICVGLNYRAHAAEGKFEVPDYPTLFGRWTASLSVGGSPATVPANERGLDWEGEVAVYIGRAVRNVDESAAVEAIFGYSTFNDLTARTAQKLTAQWTLGKNADGSGPMGPLVTTDESGHIGDGWDVSTRVNGIEVQNGNTRDMIFSPANVISLISRTLTLNPGDVLCTGTPEGVGYVRTPPWLLGAGDVVEVEIGPLGVLATPIVEEAVSANS